MKTWTSLGLVIILAACSAGPGRIVTVEVQDEAVRSAQAAALAAQGHYLGFKKAVRLYGELYAVRSLRARTAGPLMRTTLLLAMREKALGIDNPKTLESAGRLMEENAALSGFGPAMVLISAMPLRTKGVMKDIDQKAWDKPQRDRIAEAEAEVMTTAGTNEFSAAVVTAWFCSFGRFSEKWRDPAELGRIFPGSLLLKYEAAVCGESKAGILEEILAREPGFAEAHYHLGEAVLMERKLFKAEEHLLLAFEAIPESPQVRILLAGIYFATEEFEKGLRFYDLTLEISPEYRDALLGKAICLSYLRRHEEAMAVLERNVSLGFWLLGESHYWLSWNLHELKNEGEALRHIDEAKGRLPDNAHVWSLGGTIALETGDLERAEKDFLESLKSEPSGSDALFGLGTVHTRRSNWLLAGEFFEKAGQAFAAEAASLLAAIADLTRSSLAEERKARLIQRRTSQLERVRLTRATSYYNAAAAYFNAGSNDKAAVAAEAALAHPSLKEKAEELLRSVRK